MVDIKEQNLTFHFSEGWDAIKFDDTPWHREQMKSLLKAIEILARHHQHQWWIEVKDCRGYETENFPRLSPKEPDEVKLSRAWVEVQGLKPFVSVSRRKAFIVDELLEKLRDTLVSLTFASRVNHPALADFSVSASKPEKLTIVLL